MSNTVERYSNPYIPLVKTCLLKQKLAWGQAPKGIPIKIVISQLEVLALFNKITMYSNIMDKVFVKAIQIHCTSLLYRVSNINIFHAFYLKHLFLTMIWKVKQFCQKYT